LLTAQGEERERISRELQLLTAIGLDIDWALRHSPEKLEGLKERLNEANALVRQAIAETRELCATLRPGELAGTRPIDEVRVHATEFARRSDLALCFTCDASDVDFSEQAVRDIYRIVQEALSNIGRYS